MEVVSNCEISDNVDIEKSNVTYKLLQKTHFSYCISSLPLYLCALLLYPLGVFPISEDAVGKKVWQTKSSGSRISPVGDPLVGM